MTVLGGYWPQILRVDLSRGSVSPAPLPSEDVLRRYVGGTGLGLYFLLRDAPPMARATDAEAPLIFMVGCGHVEDDQWKFSCLIADRLEESSEVAIIDAWIAHMERTVMRVGCGTSKSMPSGASISTGCE